MIVETRSLALERLQAERPTAPPSLKATDVTQLPIPKTDV